MKDLNEITTKMMEHVCDKLCRYSREAQDQEELEYICSECKMGRFVCDIINLGKSNFERLTVDQVAELLYQNDKVDKACKGEYDENDTLVCPSGQTGEKQECLECIKRWMMEEAVEIDEERTGTVRKLKERD